LLDERSLSFEGNLVAPTGVQPKPGSSRIADLGCDHE
jgi:hypothetical protein